MSNWLTIKQSLSADIKLDWYPSSRQEVRLKFQWVGIDALVQNSYILNDWGNLSHSSFQSENFSYSDTALQMRYRFQLAPLSDIYIVYSRGGYFESGVGNEGAKDLFDNGWRNTHVESIVAKVRYKF